jgi:hypothetical protein
VIMAPVLLISTMICTTADTPSENIGYEHSPSSSKLVGQPHIESYG